MDIAKELKKIMTDENVVQDELAKRLHVTQQNISAKFSKNDFRISELINIASKLGYKINIEFIKEDKIY